MNERRLPNDLNLPFVEHLYSEYLRNPAEVSAEWREFFQQWGDGERVVTGPSFRPFSLFNPPDGAWADGGKGAGAEASEFSLQDRVDQLLRAYRTRGHMMAQLDPLGLPRPVPPELDPGFYGFTEGQMERQFSCETLHEAGQLPLGEILQRLRNTYCRSIGVEYMHIDDLSVRRWMQKRMEFTENRINLG
jgi:2-oxoglutarate dehydrogenase E1 component